MIYPADLAVPHIAALDPAGRWVKPGHVVRCTEPPAAAAADFRCTDFYRNPIEAREDVR